MKKYEAELLVVLTRLVDVLERRVPPITQSPIDPGASPDLLPIDQGPVPAVKPPRSAVTVLRRNYLASDLEEVDDRGLTSGGTVPEEFWSRKDEYPKAKRDKIKPRKMGRPFA